MQLSLLPCEAAQSRCPAQKLVRGRKEAAANAGGGPPPKSSAHPGWGRGAPLHPPSTPSHSSRRQGDADQSKAVFRNRDEEMRDPDFQRNADRCIACMCRATACSCWVMCRPSTCQHARVQLHKPSFQLLHVCMAPGQSDGYTAGAILGSTCFQNNITYSIMTSIAWQLCSSCCLRPRFIILDVLCLQNIMHLCNAAACGLSSRSTSNEQARTVLMRVLMHVQVSAQFCAVR